MKKTYIIPEMLSVALNTKTSILQASLKINSDPSNTIDDASHILTKENKDVNIWDEEW